MKTTTFSLTLFLLCFFSFDMYSQTWGGSTSISGHTGRWGQVSIIQQPASGHPAFYPYDFQFLVVSDTRKYGIRNVCSSTAQYGISTEVVNSATKAYSLTLVPPPGTIGGTSIETFSVLGDGNVFAKGLTIKNSGGNKTFVVLDNGKVFATEVTIKHPPVFPDYVFKKDYSLMSLYQVEKYINTHHRLPNIPSANEIADKGLSVGNMQVLQMEKIEELTLYMIEMRKEIDKLKKQNDELKKQLDSKN